MGTYSAGMPRFSISTAFRMPGELHVPQLPLVGLNQSIALEDKAKAEHLFIRVLCCCLPQLDSRRRHVPQALQLRVDSIPRLLGSSRVRLHSKVINFRTKLSLPSRPTDPSVKFLHYRIGQSGR